MEIIPGMNFRHFGLTHQICLHTNRMSSAKVAVILKALSIELGKHTSNYNKVSTAGATIFSLILI